MMSAEPAASVPIPDVAVQEPFRTDLGPRESIIELGYAFLPGLLPRSDVLRVRDQLLRCAAASGWLAAGSDPDAATPSDQAPSQHDHDAVAPTWRSMQQVEALHALGDEPRLGQVIEDVLGEPSFRYPSTVHRLKFPGDLQTPPHADWYHLQGSPDCLTAWIPLGDVPAEAAGLAVLAGSHRLGLFRSDWTSTDDPAIRWHGGDFAAGDVLVFHTLAVHGSLPNDGAAIRLSADFRFQPLRDPVHEAWMVPHWGLGSWDEITADWTRPDARPWEHLPITVTDQREDDWGKLAGRCRSRLWNSV